MPTFIDRHALTAVPSAVRHQLRLEVLHGLVDASGAVPLGHWLEDGYLYCVVEVPAQDALRQHHAARGLSCDDVHPIGGLRGMHPLTEAEQVIVSAAIDELWHAVRQQRS